MSNDNRKIFRETSRWIRVGFLTISVLGPVIETIASRLRQRSTALRDEAAKRSSEAYQQSQERLAATGAAIADTVGNLRDDAYRQELLKRSSRVGRDLAERGGKATQTVIERGNDVLQDLTERSEKASRELVQRTSRASKDITKRGKQVSKEVRRQSKRASRELQRRSKATQRELAKRTVQLTRPQRQQNNVFLLIFGFSISLIAASIAVYLLIKKRLDRYTQANQQMSLGQNTSLNGTGYSINTASTEPLSVGQPSLTLVDPVTDSTLAEPVVDPSITTEPELNEDEPATEKMPIISISGTISGQPTPEQETAQPENSTATENDEILAVAQPDTTDSYSEANDVIIPTDARFLGVVSTRTYHPIETPLDILPTPEAGTLEVIYFVTADEAQEQGYRAAQPQ
jgi:hypothetical protein